jgi:hypothetical protein
VDDPAKQQMGIMPFWQIDPSNVVRITLFADLPEDLVQVKKQRLRHTKMAA